MSPFCWMAHAPNTNRTMRHDDEKDNRGNPPYTEYLAEQEQCSWKTYLTDILKDCAPSIIPVAKGK
jgi:hypothetical protein